MPTVLKRARGTVRSRNRNDDEPEFETSLPEPPEALSERAKTEYYRIGRQLERLGLVADVDGAALAAYAQTYARWLEAEEALREEGLVITTKMGQTASPYHRICMDCLREMRSLLVEFGLSPSSRTRLKVAGSKKPKDPREAELAALLDGTN